MSENLKNQHSIILSEAELSEANEAGYDLSHQDLDEINDILAQATIHQAWSEPHLRTLRKIDPADACAIWNWATKTMQAESERFGRSATLSSFEIAASHCNAPDGPITRKIHDADYCKFTLGNIVSKIAHDGDLVATLLTPLDHGNIFQIYWANAEAMYHLIEHPEAEIVDIMWDTICRLHTSEFGAPPNVDRALYDRCILGMKLPPEKRWQDGTSTKGAPLFL